MMDLFLVKHMKSSIYVNIILNVIAATEVNFRCGPLIVPRIPISFNLKPCGTLSWCYNVEIGASMTSKKFTIPIYIGRPT